ncbi:MAG TPA: hypothetical protein VL025_11800 [Thermoanaerobaculia bacterium]|nr:hypothetical protein [Thermoanaerobaculia bacterium]
MPIPYDQLSKSLLHDTLDVAGRVDRQHEVRADVQAADAWFVPDRTRLHTLADRGLLGRMASSAGPSLFEPFHQPPRLDDLRACIRKQLTQHAARLRRARRTTSPRPRIPTLWIISAGRPDRVIHHYGFTPLPGWPPGCWTRDLADALRLIVVSELPRTRDTLMLRLMGAGRVLSNAIADLERLPEDAWERNISLPVLLDLRFITPNNGSDEEREFLMSTHRLYDQWLQHHRSEGALLTLRRLIRAFYESRRGPMPPALVALLEATDDLERLETWALKIPTSSPADIDAMLAASA